MLLWVPAACEVDRSPKRICHFTAFGNGSYALPSIALRHNGEQIGSIHEAQRFANAITSVEIDKNMNKERHKPQNTLDECTSEKQKQKPTQPEPSMKICNQLLY
eukprot:1415385-Amphidinium_carterae.2